jgi:hypothetical protein
VSQPESGPPIANEVEPRRGLLIASLVFVAAALVLCWPMLGGQILAGSDYSLAGWAFRNFGAEYWREHHAIPLWNPFIFGGMPYVAGMHGDIFYPTAWLRYFLPLDLATNLTFAGHIILAGITMYSLLRRLGTSWTAAVVAGLGYELTGIVSSMVSPGHDGKLFVSSLAPLVFLGLLRGIRDGKASGYAGAALAIGLAFHGHPQSSTYLLVAASIWTLFLVFGHPAGPRGPERWKALGWSGGAVALGIGIYAVQLLPALAYVPFSPRADGGPSTGWEYMTGYAFPPAELFTTFLPQLNGIKDAYAGTNYFKDHSEHLGVVVILLAVCGLGGQRGRRERMALGAVALLFLLVAFGAHTPFYRLWYEFVPMMQKVRAPGMAFFLVALPVCVFAGFGVDRIRRGEVSVRRIAIAAGVFAFLGILGAVGGLDGIAQAIAAPQLVQNAVRHAPDLHAGALRLLLFAAVGGGLILAIGARRLSGAAASVALLVVVTADLWSVDRHFFEFSGTAESRFGDDQITTTLRKTPLPYRVWDPKGPEVGGLEVYPGSWLMGRDIPQLLGYHGNELNYFDETLGGKNQWKHQISLPMLQLFAIRYVLAIDTIQVPGFRRVMGPVPTTPGRAGYLYEADSAPPYARLMAAAVKAPDAQVADVVADPRFPVLAVAVYADSEKVTPAEVGSSLPPPPTATARIAAWEPGKIRVAIDGRDERPLYLVVAENWYKDWRATVDGATVPALRAQHTLLSVAIPPGAKEVAFEFRSPEYARGRLITLVSLAIVSGVFLVPRLRKRRGEDA